MKLNLSVLFLAVFAWVAPVMAQSAEALSTQSTTSQTSVLDVPMSAQAVVAAVNKFSMALAAGDLKTVETLLMPDVIILESGSVERSRSEYLGHHAQEDVEFLASAHVALMQRTARTDGDNAWVASESEVQARHDGIPMTLISTETMVLKKVGSDWRIAHIHWSSRSKG